MLSNLGEPRAAGRPRARPSRRRADRRGLLDRVGNSRLSRRRYAAAPARADPAPRVRRQAKTIAAATGRARCSAGRGSRPRSRTPAHRALAALERAGVIAGVITQNVDGLHSAAGSREVVELHGALARVRCLACGEITRAHDAAGSAARRESRRGRRVRGWRRSRPTATSICPTSSSPSFDVVACAACDGVLMPDVVFFGGSVPRATLDAAWALFDRAELLLVVGSSLTVFSRLSVRAARGRARRAGRDLESRPDARRPARTAAASMRRCGEALPRLATRVA